MNVGMLWHRLCLAQCIRQVHRIYDAEEPDLR